MSYQCKLPCLPPSVCMGEAVHTNTCPSHCAMVDLDPCLVQDVHLCPGQTCQVDHCLCQGAATRLDSCPQVGSTCPPFAVPVPGDACTLPCVISCMSACVTAAATPCETHQSEGGTSFPFQLTDSPVELCTPETAETCMENFPLQHAISPVEPCIPKKVGTYLENLPLQHPISTVEPCTTEVLETCTETLPLGCTALTKKSCCCQDVTIGDACPDQCLVTCVDPCISQSVICADPCMSQSTTEPTGTCPPQSTMGPADTSSMKGKTKGAGAPLYIRAPFCLNTCTSTIMERCLHRCQMWLRGKK